MEIVGASDIREFKLLTPLSACGEIPPVELIGELAPLLSVLGHQMHKRHKSAATSIWTYRPIWMCVAALSVRAVSYQLLCNNCNV